MSTFALIDGVSTAEYLWRNGIRPAHLIFSLKDLEESIAYCDPEEDSILCVINGCTEITYEAMKSVLELFYHCQTVRGIAIFSNVPLYAPRFDMSYIFFEGDLMAGKEWFANTSMKFTNTNALKAIPEKDKRINKFKVTEATEDNVDIGIVPHKYIIPVNDSVPRHEIIQLDIFNQNNE